MKTNNKTEELRKIRDEVWNLKQSPLYSYREKNKYYPVLGEGNHNASVMFIGEAPGKNEAESGRPFCGSAGKVLDTLLESINLSRDDVYITNIVKDRPQDNRDPLPEEISIYGPYLDKQIEIIRPKIIIALGRFSSEYLMEKLGLKEQLEPISKMHGKLYKANTSYGEVYFIPMYHPAVAIYDRDKIDILREDFKIIKDTLLKQNNK